MDRWTLWLTYEAGLGRGGVGGWVGNGCLLCHALANVVLVIGGYVTVAYAQVVHRIAVSWVGE